jgi:hypothetical protein
MVACSPTGLAIPPLRRGAKPFDEFGRPVGEIEQCALFDLTVLAIGFAQ